ncbi:MAG: ABC transporter permease subunit [Fimbriimonadales bacterium]
MSQMENPIADLSYRNYDGPKSVSGARWWPIARNGIRLTMRKKGFWVLVALAWFPYLMLILQLFFSTMTEQTRMNRMIDLPKYAESLAAAFGQWPMVLFIALLCGAGAIAADNRSNALQIYLAKSISKNDYLIGKWLSIFLTLFAVVFLPMFLITLYAAFSLGFSDFIKTDGLLFVKIPFVAAIPAFVHASVLCGVSAWNKSPMIAGLIYSGIFFAWNIFSQVMGLVLEDRLSPVARQTLDYLSLQGSISGLGQTILGVAPRALTDARFDHPPLPYWPPLLLLAVLFCVFGILIARARIRAVEVVQG